MAERDDEERPRGDERAIAIGDMVRTWLPLLLAFGGMAGGYAVLRDHTTATESRLAALEADYRSYRLESAGQTQRFVAVESAGGETRMALESIGARLGRIELNLVILCQRSGARCRE